MKTLFKIDELPLAQLEAIGLYQDKQLLLSPSEVGSLLAGRRTSLISLNQINAGNISIERLDARLSLGRKASGEAELLINPIYKKAREHPLLNHEEMESLISEKTNVINKKIQQEEGRYTMYNIEYDPLTRDFIGYDVAQVQAPDRINGMLLSEEEKSAFKRGETVELEDGTKVMHRASEPKGMRSDRNSLVLSVLLDGGISYLLLRGIRSLNERAQQLDHQTPAFNKALNDMQGGKDIPAEHRPLANEIDYPTALNNHRVKR